MYDIVFCSLPYSDLDQIYSAPAILKGVAVTNGFKAKTVDFGCRFLNQLDRNIERFNETQIYFITAENNNFKNYHEIEKFYDNCIDFFKKNPSTYIALSVLSIFTQRCVYELCLKIKEHKINSKIVVGGRGAKVSTYENVANVYNLKGKERLKGFGEFLVDRKLADILIIGDGEEAILELLQKNTVSKSEFISDEFRSPIPDYSDYNFSDYLYHDTIMLPVTGSKGCVRDCDFCDIKFQFGKYRYRSGADIANEMIAVSSKYNVYKFQFTDSLVNGGMKPFKEFLETLSEYNLTHPDKRIYWNGQYICRPYNETPKDLYKLMRDSGAHGLTIGAESGSNKVLDAMNKKTTVEALLTELECFRKHNITCILLTFVGHWSETWEDFVEHCKMLVNLTPYVRSGTISAVSLGQPFILLDGTPSMFNHKLNNIIYDEFDPKNNWLNIENPSNTLKERIYRRLTVHQLCKKLKIPTITDAPHLLQYISYIESNYREINDFYDKNSQSKLYQH
jgi:hypothetical protein